MEDNLKLEYSEQEVTNMTAAERSILLVKIALMNRHDLNIQSNVIFGNGDIRQGLCGKVLSQGNHIKGIWATLCVGGGSLFTLLIQHMIK